MLVDYILTKVNALIEEEMKGNCLFFSFGHLLFYF